MQATRYGRRLALAVVATAALLIAWPHPAQAQQARLLRDIAVGAEVASGDPRFPLVQAGKKVYFSATDGDHGRKLWSSDGTAEGTSRVTDLAPGPTSSNPENLVALRDSLYFFARDAAGDPGLWQTNGSPASTRLLFSLGKERTAWSNCVAVVGDLIYFVVLDGASNLALWRSDGTSAAPSLLLELGSGLDVLGIAMLPAGDSLVMSVTRNNGVTTTLWGTRGTAASTTKLKQTSSWVRELATVGARVFFTVDDEGEQEAGLWLTDGTLEGTRQVEPFAFSYGDGSGLFNLTPAGGFLYFGSNYMTWVSDGTPEGTGRASTINPDTMVAAGERLYTFTRVSSDIADGCTLHAEQASGATSSGPPTPCGSCGIHAALDGCPSAEAALGEAVVMVLPEADSYELLRSDATAEGTVVLRSFPRFDAAGAELHGPEVIGQSDEGLLYLRAFTDESGWELWETDGTASGTIEVRNLNPVTAQASSNPSYRGFASGGRRYFIADDGVHGSGLWVDDAQGTRLLDLGGTPEGLRDAFVVESKAGVFAFSYAGTDLSVHRLESTGPALLWQTTTTGLGSSCVTDRYAYVEAGPSIWRIGDAGPVAVGEVGLYSSGCMAIGSTAVYVTTEDGSTFTLSSISDDGAALVPFAQHTAGAVYALTVIRDRLYYEVRPSQTGPGDGAKIEVWEWQVGAAQPIHRSEFDATRRVHLLPLGDGLAVVQDEEAGSTCTLWDDDVRHSTQLLAVSTALSGFVFDGTLYLLEGALGAPTPSSRYAMWRSDGTPEGTHRLADGLSTLTSISPLPNGDGLVFSDGAEMWTCGIRDDVAAPFRPEGLRTVFDAPSNFVRSGDRLLFAASDPEHGRELWVLEPEEPPAASGCAAAPSDGRRPEAGRASWLAIIAAAAMARVAARRRARAGVEGRPAWRAGPADA